jgi:hypothetical protein
MLAAILFSFKAYELYQPTILSSLGFTALVQQLGVWQGLLGLLVEPLVGGWSDRILQRVGSRLPQIAVGITIAGLIFVIIALLPGSWLQPESNVPGFSSLRGLVPLLMLAWLVAMIAVRGPVVAMLRQFAPVDALPQANAVIILVLGLVGAVGPLLDLVLTRAGAAPSFALGAIALMVGCLIVFRAIPQHRLPLPPDRDLASAPRRVLGQILVVGVSASFTLGLMMAVFPSLLHQQLPSVPTVWIASGILFIAAISANPLGEMTAQLGPARAMQFGLAALIAGMVLTWVQSWVSPPVSPAVGPLAGFSAGLVLLLGLAMGLLLISIIPFALTGVPLTQSGLSTGLYFGGSGLASAMLAGLRQSGEISPTTALKWAIASGAIALICLQMSRRQHPSTR